MQTKTVEKVMKNSIVYGCAITQPFILYADSPAAHDKILAESDVLAYGENSKIVRHLQHKLTKLGHYSDAVDGVYGLLTEHAVKTFQSSNEIDVTGFVDRDTMDQLLFNEKKEQLDAIREELDDIYFGAESEQVQIVQEVLFYYGYYQGNIDGIYGPLTEEAIQRVKNEGLLGDNTLSGSDEINNAQLNRVPEETQTIDKQESVQNKEIVQVKTQNNHAELIATAKEYIGSPYVWGGTTPAGFDCSGFIQFVYEQQNIVIPRTVAEIWNFANTASAPSVGDLVFFETYQAGPSHLGIYLGNGNFIHAGVSRGVEISNMNSNGYWQERYLGAKQIVH